MMRTRALCTRALIAACFLTPSVLFAQRGGVVRTGASPGQIGRLTRENCAGTDTARTFRRTVSAPAGTTPVTGGTARSQAYPEYDVVLDVPNLCVERITLKVDSLTARLALNAQVANLLRVRAGADVLIGNVDLNIQGVRAQALLLVDLDDVVQAVDQTLTFVDNHPEVVEQLTGTVANTGAAVGGLVNQVVNGLLLGSSRNASGQVVQRLLDQVTGNIVERTLSSAGQAIGEKVVGKLTDLTQVKQATNAAGQLVRQVRDSSGKVIEYVQDAAGKLSSVRIVP
ncbi:MAG TPA: hypothetical protein VGD77_16815 [Gemmatimonadaceae bacterium]